MDRTKFLKYLKGKNLLFLLIGLFLLLVLVFASWFVFANMLTRTENTSNGTSNQEQAENTSSTKHQVMVYFSKHPDSDNDPGETFPVVRNTTSSAVATFAIEQLLLGPTKAESEANYFRGSITLNGESDCSGKDFSLNIYNGKATLRFCRATSLSGVMSDAQLESAINATLKQFSSVQKVIILNKNNDCLFDLSGLNKCKI